MSLPSCHHPTDRPNFCVARVGDLTLWFSYRTCIAFSSPDTGRVVCENVWGSTTGKHLNFIEPRKGERIDRETFEKQLQVLIEPVGSQ